MLSLWSVRMVCVWITVSGDMLEKPCDFDPFGQTGLSPLATI